MYRPAFLTGVRIRTVGSAAMVSPWYSLQVQAECRSFPSEDGDGCRESVVGRRGAQLGLVSLEMGDRGAPIVAESAMMRARKRIAAVVLVQEEMSGAGEMRDRQTCMQPLPKNRVPPAPRAR